MVGGAKYNGWSQQNTSRRRTEHGLLKSYTTMSFEITPSIISEYSKDVENDPAARVAMNACWKGDPLEICSQPRKIVDLVPVFSHKVENEGKPVTNQKSAGTCWIFSALNVIRLPFIKQYNLEEFEFSQTFLFFLDKIERCNYFLNNMVELALREEDVEGRLMSFLLKDPTCDGGQWDMFVNLVTKYGLMPKKCYPECYSSEHSTRLNSILKSQLREYALQIRQLISTTKDEKDIQTLLKKQMSQIYRIVSICLTIPPASFTWEYYDKSKAYHKIGPISPKQFYEEHVKPYFNVEEKVCIVTDPRPKNPYGHAYTVEYLGNVHGGRKTVYNNQPVEALMKYVTESIKNNEAVWFGCQVAKRLAGKYGLMDLELHDYKTIFGVDVQLGMTKANRLIYGEALMTHAMAFTAVTCDENGDSIKFRVENSWGEDKGTKGYYILTADWFKEFVFEIVVDKKIIPKEVLDVLDQEPTVLPAWDPMGSLA